MTENNGILLVVSGPSGAGKGTVLQDVKGMPGIHYSISATTRARRAGEMDGVHYHFLEKAAFDALIEADGLIEYAAYCGDYYGTPRAPVEKALARSEVVILEIETVGAARIKEAYPDCVSLFITPCRLSELRRRLIRRGTEDMEKIERRIARAREEIREAHKYDYIVLNDTIEDAVDTILSIIRAERAKSARIAQALHVDI